MLSPLSRLQLGPNWVQMCWFCRGTECLCGGHWERLTAVEIDEYWYLVITPIVRCLQGKFFHPQLTRNSPAIKIRALSEEQYRNDCQPVVEALFPR